MHFLKLKLFFLVIKMQASIQTIFADYLAKVKNLYEEVITTGEQKNNENWPIPLSSKLDKNKKIKKDERKNRKHNVLYNDAQFNVPEEKLSMIIEDRDLMRGQYLPMENDFMERKHRWETYVKDARKKSNIRNKQLFPSMKMNEPNIKYKTNELNTSFKEPRPKKLLTPVKEVNEYFGYNEMDNRNIQYEGQNSRWDTNCFRPIENYNILDSSTDNALF